MTTLDTAAVWKDAKRFWWLLSPMVPPLVAWSLWNFMTTGQGAWLWGAWILIYVLIPALDVLIGTDRSNPPEDATLRLEADRYYRVIVALYIPTQFAVVAWGAWIVATQPLAWWEYLGLVFSIGLVSGIGINTAHELGHKNVAWERWLAKLTLAPVAYGHFFVEHNRGHHIRVATPEDPASARLGESFWASCRARWPARWSRPGRWRRSGCNARARASGAGATRTCRPGR